MQLQGLPVGICLSLVLLGTFGSDASLSVDSVKSRRLERNRVEVREHVADHV